MKHLSTQDLKKINLIATKYFANIKLSINTLEVEFNQEIFELKEDKIKSHLENLQNEIQNFLEINFENKISSKIIGNKILFNLNEIK